MPARFCTYIFVLRLPFRTVSLAVGVTVRIFERRNRQSGRETALISGDSDTPNRNICIYLRGELSSFRRRTRATVPACRTDATATQYKIRRYWTRRAATVPPAGGSHRPRRASVTRPGDAFWRSGPRRGRPQSSAATRVRPTDRGTEREWASVVRRPTSSVTAVGVSRVTDRPRGASLSSRNALLTIRSRWTDSRSSPPRFRPSGGGPGDSLPRSTAGAIPYRSTAGFPSLRYGRMVVTRRSCRPVESARTYKIRPD